MNKFTCKDTTLAGMVPQNTKPVLTPTEDSKPSFVSAHSAQGARPPVCLDPRGISEAEAGELFYFNSFLTTVLTRTHSPPPNNRTRSKLLLAPQTHLSAPLSQSGKHPNRRLETHERVSSRLLRRARTAHGPRTEGLLTMKGAQIQMKDVAAFKYADLLSTLISRARMLST